MALTQPNQLVYLACPYSHPDPTVREQRFERANQVAAQFMRAGVLIFSPISHTHPIAMCGLPKGWDFWERFDRIYLSLCDAMVVLQLSGWKESKGVRAEIAVMQEQRKPIFYTTFRETRKNLKRLLAAGEF